jgi:hypothetical protein
MRMKSEDTENESGPSFFESICKNFHGYCFQKVPSFDEKLIFGSYDRYEKYDENKQYHKEKYLAIYTGTPQYYVDYIYCIDCDGEQHYFAVSKRVSTEMDELSKFCPCVRCTTRSFNPLKYIWCQF